MNFKRFFLFLFSSAFVMTLSAQTIYLVHCPRAEQIRTTLIDGPSPIRYWHAVIDGVHFSGKNKLDQKVMPLQAVHLQGQSAVCTYRSGATMTNNGDIMGYAHFINNLISHDCLGGANYCRFALVEG